MAEYRAYTVGPDGHLTSVKKTPVSGRRFLSRVYFRRSPQQWFNIGGRASDVKSREPLKAARGESNPPADLVPVSNTEQTTWHPPT